MNWGLASPRIFIRGVHDPIKIPSDPTELLSWLNRPFQFEHQIAIQKALCRTQFEFQKTGWKRKILDYQTLL